MPYSTGMMNKRVAVMNPDTTAHGDFGRQSAGRQFKYAGTFWASVDFNKGARAMQEGALDAYDYLMVRMRWNNVVQRRSMIVWDGRTFAIESFNDDFCRNQIQLTIKEDPGKDLTGLLPDPSSSELSTDIYENGDI